MRKPQVHAGDGVNPTIGFEQPSGIEHQLTFLVCVHGRDSG
jgi:hypothetical protein